MKKWIEAARLRTLPLALSCVFFGSAFSRASGLDFHINVFIWGLITTVILQIVSNLANDYGDWQNGADNHLRAGPLRAVQSGGISPKAMKIAMVCMSIIAFCSGLYLLYLTTSWISIYKLSVLLGLGLMAIIAALTYTSGKNPYGYSGLGDLSVFLFFGIVGTQGIYFLQTGNLGVFEIMPAIGVGCLAVAVLNLNNMRDIESDNHAHKKTIPVRFGIGNAKRYHFMLLLLSWVTLNFYSFFIFDLQFFSVLLVFSTTLTIWLQIKIKKVIEIREYDKYLKPTALYTFILSILFFAGTYL